MGMALVDMVGVSDAGEAELSQPAQGRHLGRAVAAHAKEPAGTRQNGRRFLV